MSRAATWDGFETLAARTVAGAHAALSPDLQDLAFASPLATRTPDLEHVWHRGLRKSEPGKVESLQQAARQRQLGRAVARVGLKPTRYGWRMFGTVRDRFVVCTSLVGKVTGDGRWETGYLPADPDDAMLVFGPLEDLGDDANAVEHLSPKAKIRISRELVRAGRSAVPEDALEYDARLLEMVWHQWAAGLLWLSDYYLSRVLDDLFGAEEVRVVGCVHEMHAYARTVWSAARRASLPGVTLQHADLAWGKRWYFPHPVELKAGLATPDVMHVYSARAVELLESALVDTEFRLGCSARFAQWRDADPLIEEGTRVVLVGAMAAFDNEVLLQAARRLIDSGAGDPLVLRLHPQAMLSSEDERWIDDSARNGSIEISEGRSLAEDLERAQVVVGVGTTVLEEALLLGRPVLQITSDDYVDYIDLEGLAGVRSVPVSDVVSDDIQAAVPLVAEPEQVRERLGLEHPVVDYERLFHGVALGMPQGGAV